MAWFLNFYLCYRCKAKWRGKWSCMVDDQCPYCDARDISPYDADDLTFLVTESPGEYAVLRSPETAEHTPDYVEVAKFSTRESADAYVAEVDE
jgi:hypothetical protein